MRPILIFALFAAASPVAAKPTAAGAEAFLAKLYKPYQAEPTQVVDVLKRPDLYFEARLVEAMRADNDAAAKRGEVPLLNGDPICDCQDYIPFRPTIGPVKLSGNRAEATVRFNNGNERELHYQLIATRKGWRIVDIRSRDDSLRGLYKL